MSAHDDRMLRIGRLLQQLDEMETQMSTVTKVVTDLQREVRLSSQLAREAARDARRMGVTKSRRAKTVKKKRKGR